ncbi:hypothetical protein LINGRAHAP2_LOCUS24130 [Linum grandiflorum]
MYHGECTITLEDVEMLTGLPVSGEAVCGSTRRTGSTGPRCVERFWEKPPNLQTWRPTDV